MAEGHAVNVRLHTDPPAPGDRGVLWLAVAVAVLGLSSAGAISYLIHRVETSDARNARHDRDVCAILANIPGHVPSEIARARRDFAPSGHPAACMPIVQPKVRAVPTPTATPAPATTVLIVPAPTAPSGPQPRHTRRSTPSQHPTHPPSPPPSPAPTPTCSLRHPLKCL